MRKNRYTLIVAAVVISLIIYQMYVLTPESETIREEIQTKSASLEKFESYLEGSAITESEIKTATEAMKAFEKKLIAEPSEFLASARVQREVSELTEKNGLNMQTIRPLKPVKMKSFSSFPVYFEGSGTIRQIGEFLKAIESAQVLLKIDKLSVNVTNMQNTRELRFKMQISGLGKV